MNEKLKKAFKAEMSLGRDFYSRAQYKDAFHHFERAHVLGQFYVIPHARTHVWMLIVGLKTRNLREIVGQLIRIPLGMIASALGKAPLGNTGGANIKLSKTLPIPEDLKTYLDQGDSK